MNLIIATDNSMQPRLDNCYTDTHIMRYEKLQTIINNAQHIVILQADNPDADSLGSSLALEAILEDIGKTVTMVCAVDIPSYLRYLDGSDRVLKNIPNKFDATIIVDTSSETLFESLNGTNEYGWVKTKPVVVIDHHASTDGISWATVEYNEDAVATSEIIHRIAVELGWPLPIDACNMMVVSIMSDSVGLVSEATTANTFSVMADLVERGANLPMLDNKRRELMRKDPKLINYKGELLQRVHIDQSGRIAYVMIPFSEIERYSPLYNPSMLVIDDMRMTVGVDVAIAFKVYKDGKITGKIRCNYGSGIGGELGMLFGGGGHKYAAGFKVTDGTPYEDLKIKVIKEGNRLLDELDTREDSY